ncbi:MAG TPA: ROK family transcriptional regulator [Actinomycetes bacterium]
MRADRAHQASALRVQGLLAVLRHVHAHPGATRAELSRALDLRSSSAAEITARLKALRLVTEGGVAPTGSRGRPSPVLVAHAEGPLVCAAEVSHERWRVATVQLGGVVVDHREGRHRRRAPDAVLGAVREEVAALHRRYGERLRAVSVSLPATVRGEAVVQASNLRWRDVSLEPLRPAPATPLLVGNDASLAGVGESRRGAALGLPVVLHLTIEVGVGGVLVVDGRAMTGASGAGGEFGHMPFGDPARRCLCGAAGCWDLEVDGRAMARILGRPAPRDPRSAANRVLAEAAAGDPTARRAVERVTAAFGRGVAALVNALDPDVVTLSGLALGLAGAAPGSLQRAYRAGLMRFRRAQPPPLVPSALGDDGTLVGAAEVAFDTVLTDLGLAAWSAGPARSGAGAGRAGRPSAS